MHDITDRQHRIEAAFGVIESQFVIYDNAEGHYLHFVCIFFLNYNYNLQKDD